MRKILLILCVFIFTTGCVNIKKIDYKENIQNIIQENYNNKYYNRYANGYKYYLPKYMSVKNSIDYNEKINSNDYTYYLYIDIVSYYNKLKLASEKNNNYINYNFEYKDLKGFLNVLKKDDKYLVEILYNYAKIEVIVDELNINEAINNSIIILSTLKYDDNIIENLIKENKINTKEETLNIFNKDSNNDNFIDIIEEYDNYEDEEDIPDYNKIN